MQPLKLALETTTSHGLPRIVTNKPIYIRLIWLLLFLLMLGLFLKGFYALVVKLQSRPVTTLLEVNSAKFQFPDVYACLENPVSASYSASIDKKSVDAINKGIGAARQKFMRLFNASYVPAEGLTDSVNTVSHLFPQSLPYNLLVDSLAHRAEQSVIDSYVVYKGDDGMPSLQQIEPLPFYDPVYLRCFRWSINKTDHDKVVRRGMQSGLVAILLVDTTSADMPIRNVNTSIPLSDWSLSLLDLDKADRHSGVRVFLTPPRESPSDFVTSFSLSTGKRHTVEISMSQQEFKEGQFDNCVSGAPDIQFVNHYHQTPYTHAYSYSYCYYYEYHSQSQIFSNLSGSPSPLPWPLRGMPYAYNLSVDNNIFTLDGVVWEKVNQIEQQAQLKCEEKRPCSTLDYSVSISSANWPTHSSLVQMINTSIKQAWTSARSNNLTVPVLDFLMNANMSSLSSYVRNNLLKVQFKPRKVLCEKVTFSIDYGLENFISDVGGIMGIYLGMSLLTMCELLELFYDLVAFHKGTKKIHENQGSAVPVSLS